MIQQYQCVDGQFYRNPHWFGSTPEGKRWRIDPVEDIFPLRLMVEIKMKKGSITMARNIIKDWPVVLGKAVFDEYGIFDETDPDTVDVVIIPFEPRNKLPIPPRYNIATLDAMVNELEYCWEVEFQLSQLWDVFNKSEDALSPYLTCFLMGRAILNPTPFLNKIKARLRSQFPGLGKLSLPAAIEKYGERVKVQRCLSALRKSGQSTGS